MATFTVMSGHAYTVVFVDFIQGIAYVFVLPQLLSNPNLLSVMGKCPAFCPV